MPLPDVESPTREAGHRDCGRSGLGSGFAAAVQPVSAQTQITTPSDGLVAGEVTVGVGDFTMPAYRAMPAGQSGRPVVLVVSEIFGVHEHIADVARRFARQGYFAIAPELFVRQGDAASYAETGPLIAEVVNRARDVQVMADLDACVAWAKAQGADTTRLGITGFCWGGRIEAPMLGLYGAADSGIPNDTVEQMRAALAAAGNTHSEIVLYPDTPHAFHADYRPNYRKAAADDGWQRCLAWFKANGVA